MVKTVLFDGMNLSLTHGTGVATYTRVLATMARQRLGYGTGILYGRRTRLPRSETAREVVFFDAAPPPTRFDFPFGQIPGWIASSFTGVRPQRVPVTGTVVTQPLGITYVPSDAVYSAPRVFDHGRVHFAVTNSFLKVNLPERPDLFHWTFPLPIVSNARANIYTIHDLVPLRLPYAAGERKNYHYRMLKKLVAKADHIVTVSEHSKRDIVQILGVDEKRVTNTYESIDIPPYIAERSEDIVASELANMYGLDMRGYLLFYGSLEPKKNISRILQAYLAADVQIPLVVVFAQTWLAENEEALLDQAIEPMNPKFTARGKHVYRYEYLPFRLLTTLIRGARAVVFPSLYEGFGLPVLEGMTLGTPVITSNTSSTPEVAGDAALLVDPHDVDAIKNAIVTVCRDDGLCEDLRKRGRKQAEKFSLDAYQERMTALYASFA